MANKITNKQEARMIIKNWLDYYPECVDEDTHIEVFDYDGNHWSLDQETQLEDLKGLKTAIARGFALVVYSDACCEFDTIRGYEWHANRLERRLNAEDLDREDELSEAEDLELGIEREKAILTKVTNPRWIIRNYEPYYLTKNEVKKHIFPFLSVRFETQNTSIYCLEQWQKFIEHYAQVY